MTNAVFTASASSIYDDLIEERYHFPKTYLRQVEEAVGDWIVYYEPRRTTGPHAPPAGKRTSPSHTSRRSSRTPSAQTTSTRR